MSSVFRFVCGNYGGYVEPAAQRRCAIRWSPAHQVFSILDSPLYRVRNWAGCTAISGKKDVRIVGRIQLKPGVLFSRCTNPH